MTHGGYPADADTMVAPQPYFTPPTVGLSTAGRGYPPAGGGFPPVVRGNGFAPPGYGFAPSPHGQRPVEVNTLATLSVVFAFVFAPVGIALGHAALSQIRFRGQAGRDRALVGLIVSYAVSLVAVLVLIVITAAASSDNNPASMTTSTTTTTIPARPSPSETTTEAAPPPVTTGAMRVEDLNVGDCVRLEKQGSDPNRPGLDFIKIYSSACAAGDNVYRVDQITSRAKACPNSFLVNSSETIFACVSKLNGA